MVSRIDIGPDGGPYVELDEDAGEFIIRVPQDNVSFDGADLNSVGTASVTALEAEYVASANSSGVPLGPHQTNLQSQKTTFSWESINWEDKGEEIIDGSSLDGSAGYPTLIHADSILADPIDTWYLYWSSHDFNDIGLATAPDLWGPWTEEGGVFSDDDGGQTSSPSILYDPRDDELKLWYHVDDSDQDVQRTKLATSDVDGDGTLFNIVGDVFIPQKDSSWDSGERSYHRVTRKGKYYVGVYQGRDMGKSGGNAAGVGVAFSLNGEYWTAEPSPAFDNTQWTDYDPQGYNGGTPALTPLNDWSLLYADRSSKNIHALPFDLRDRPLNESGETVLEFPDWADGDGIGPGEFIIGDEHLYFFYYEDNVPDNDFNIGVARAELGEVI